MREEVGNAGLEGLWTEGLELLVIVFVQGSLGLTGGFDMVVLCQMTYYEYI